MAVFEDTIKTKQFLTKSKSHKTHSELGALLSELMRHEWFTHDIQQTIERYVMGHVNNFKLPLFVVCYSLTITNI